MNNLEMLQIAESVARGKDIPRDLVLEAMEQAIEIAARKKYGLDNEIKATINRKNGDIKLKRVRTVVEEVENVVTEITLEDAKSQDPEIELGGHVYEPLPPIDLGRVAAGTAKQVITQKIREAERAKQYEEFKDRVGEILNGTVKRVEFGDVIVDLGRAEAVIKRNQVIRNENFKINDRVKAYVAEVDPEAKGPQIQLSRTSGDFLTKLMSLEVPEIYDNAIEIRAVARDPGSKAKVAVFTSDNSLDAVGSCVGMKGARIRSVTQELNGEKIDVILWNDDLAQFVINALAPAEISKVVLDHDENKIIAIVPEDQLSITIGKRGQNVRLASQLVGFDIDVTTEDQDSKRRTEEFNSTTEMFMKLLDVEEVIAQLIAVEGFVDVDQIANVDVDTLISIDGFDADLAQELQARASAYVEERDSSKIQHLEELGVEQELLDVLSVGIDDYVRLADAGIKSLEDLGEIDLSEFKGLVPKSGLSDEEIEQLIAKAKGDSGEE